MVYEYLGLPVCDRVPEGYRLIIAYAKGDDIVIPVDFIPEEQAELHNCDWEGCSSLEHSIHFNVKDKYSATYPSNAS